MGRMIRSIRGDESDRRTLFSRGLYQTMYNQDWDKAADEFESLVKLSPLDDNAINNLAVARFYQLRFDEARELSERLLQLYSYNHLLANAALYALYAGEFAEADRFAERILAHDGWSDQAALVRSLVFAESGDLDAAKDTLRSLIDHTDQQDSLLLQGLADFEMAARAWDGSEEILDEGILIDKRLRNQEHHARKLLMKAEVGLHAKPDVDLAKPLLAEAIALSDSTQTLATYALLCTQFGINEFEQVNAIVRKKTDAHGRALSKLITAIDAWFSDDLSVTTDLLKESTAIIDLWFVHFCAAHIYQKSELFLEARDEIQICLSRPGEAMCAMLDDLPTFRYLEQARRFGRIR
jgi:tetratricopeptide (TPR) repeat protein